MAHKSDTQKEHAARATSMLGKAGYSGGGKMTPTKAVHKHESHMHPGKTPTKLASGGKVGPKTVNVIIKTGNSDAEKQMAAQQGMKMGAMMASQAKPPMPMPPPGAGPGGPPPGAMPPPGMAPGMPQRPPGLKTGGVVKVKSHVRRKSGGKCE